MDFEKRRKAAEALAQIFFFICAVFTVLTVAAVIFYMICMGLPALRQLGLKEVFFGTRWKPTAAEPEFGIFYIILTSLAGTVLAAAVGVPLGIFTAVYLAELAGRRKAKLVRAAVEVLAGIPSVIYGLLGIYILNPVLYRLERKLFAGSESHTFTGGANLISAVIVLAIMMLPTVIHISETSIRAVRPGIREASLALGADKMQTILRSVLPAARPGILTAVILGVGRAAGEAMAITLVSGGSVNAPFPFQSVRFLTTAIVSEMGYAQGLHRQMLFTIGLILLGFILLVNGTANWIMGKGAKACEADKTG